jgi:hypothetical protein
MVTISGGHAPVSLRGSITEEGRLEVVVASTRDLGIANSSSSSAMSSLATERDGQQLACSQETEGVPAPLPALSLLKSFS